MCAAVLRRVWGRYEAALAHSPATTKAVVASTMFSVTDVVVQKVENSTNPKHQDRPWNARRTATQAGFGAYYGLVHAHLLWGFLEVLFGRIRAGGVVLSPLVGAISRVSLDQFIMGTPLFNSVFFYSTGRFQKVKLYDEGFDCLSRSTPGP